MKNGQDKNPLARAGALQKVEASGTASRWRGASGALLDEAKIRWAAIMSDRGMRCS